MKGAGTRGGACSGSRHVPRGYLLPAAGARTLRQNAEEALANLQVVMKPFGVASKNGKQPRTKGRDISAPDFFHRSQVFWRLGLSEAMSGSWPAPSIE
jgi:hypothetical protein